MPLDRSGHSPLSLSPHTLLSAASPISAPDWDREGTGGRRFLPLLRLLFLLSPSPSPSGLPIFHSVPTSAKCSCPDAPAPPGQQIFALRCHSTTLLVLKAFSQNKGWGGGSGGGGALRREGEMKTRSSARGEPRRLGNAALLALMLCSVVALSLIRGRFAPIGKEPNPLPSASSSYLSCLSALHLHGRIPGRCELI